MPIEILLELINRRPFAPFEIRLADGRVYRLDHTEFFARSPTNDTCVFYTDDGRPVWLAMNQVTSVEVCSSKAA